MDLPGAEPNGLSSIELAVRDKIIISGEAGATAAELNNIIRGLEQKNVTELMLGQQRRRIVERLSDLYPGQILVLGQYKHREYVWRVPQTDNTPHATTADNLLTDEVELENDIFDPDILQALGRNAPRKNWRSVANCKGKKTDLFYPERGGPTALAKKVCKGCGVRGDCLSFALATREKWGIWGGESTRARNILVKQALTILGREAEADDFSDDEDGLPDEQEQSA